MKKNIPQGADAMRQPGTPENIEWFLSRWHSPAYRPRIVHKAEPLHVTEEPKTPRALLNGASVRRDWLRKLDQASSMRVSGNGSGMGASVSWNELLQMAAQQADEEGD